MNNHHFHLSPFSRQDLDGSLSLNGKATRLNNTLSLTFALHDPDGVIKIPLPALRPQRQNRLWQDTCFEFFTRINGAAPYWECNLSLPGHWNLFHFQEYRKGMREEKSISALGFTVHRRNNGLELSVELPLQNIIPKENALDLAVCAVLCAKNGTKSYWALTHSGPEPDFHRQDSFCITL